MAAPTYFNSVSVPADNGTNATSTITVTPPGSMLTGDLVVVICASRNLAGTWSIGVTGGQTWTSETGYAAAATEQCRIFWCTFNGTWSADPRFDSADNTCTTAVMHVFRPDETTDVWAIDVAQSSATFTAPSTPFTVTITGLTTVHADVVTLACWHTGDDNTWGTISGTGWTGTGTAQYRNTSGSDQSSTYTHHLDSTAGSSVPNVSQNQLTLGGDAGVKAIIAWYAAAPPAQVSNPAFDPYSAYRHIMVR